MKILVTGAAGFIGFHLIKALVKSEHEIIGLDNLNSYYDVNLKSARLKETGIAIEKLIEGELLQSNLFRSYKFIQSDINNRDSINQLFREQKFDVVCHLAAQAGVRYSIENPEAYIDSNIVGFFNILEACRKNKVSRFIYASSSSVYGLSEKYPYSEEDATNSPVSLYSATKKSNELMAHAYSHLYGLSTIGLRFFTVYGPWGRPDMAPMLFLKAITEGEAIKIYNHGEMMRDFTFIDDVVQGIVKIISSEIKSDKLYRIYNIGSSSPVSLLDFIKTLELVTKKEAKKIFMEMQPGDVLKTYANVQQLQKDFDYSPQTSLKNGLEKLWEWYQDYNSLALLT